MSLPLWEEPTLSSHWKKAWVKAVAGLFLTLSALVIFEVVVEVLEVPHFLWPAVRLPFLKRPRFTERDVLALDYISVRKPPPGFESWLNFAKDNQCHLGPYARIEKDLQAFHVPGDPQQRKITQQQLKAAMGMGNVVVFSLSGGHLTVSQESEFTRKFARLMRRFVPLLPDMQFVVNVLDEPRILPGKGLDVDARFAQCSNASEDFRSLRHLHGTVNNRALSPDYQPADELLPIFSQTKINECYADIQYPTLYGLDNLLTPAQEREIPQWEQRNASLFFRGTTTGGFYRKEFDFKQAHRQRLVALAADKPDMDIGFTGFIQCEEEICHEMEALYGKASTVPQLHNFDYKYLMSLDGNTFVSRLPLFLSSASLVFRAGIYSEWFDEWVQEGVHYLHAKLDYSDLVPKLEWAKQHDAEARLIGLQARHFALTRLRNQDMECYLFRLLLEYSAILER